MKTNAGKRNRNRLDTYFIPWRDVFHEGDTMKKCAACQAAVLIFFAVILLNCHNASDTVEKFKLSRVLEVLSCPKAVAVDTSGNIYVTDRSEDYILKYEPHGRLVDKWGIWGPSRGDFYDYPRGIAVDASGKVYVADKGNDRIQKFSSSGEFITSWGTSGTGDGQFDYPGYGDGCPGKYLCGGQSE